MAYFGNPYVANPYPSIQPSVQPTFQYQPPQQNSITKVDGPTEAMNRFLMKYSNQLMPGFVSEPMFDVNGNQFYTLSVEADGRRNLETFDFQPHIEQIADPTIDMVSRSEFNELVDKVNQLMDGSNGILGSVPTESTTTE